MIMSYTSYHEFLQKIIKRERMFLEEKKNMKKKNNYAYNREL